MAAAARAAGTRLLCANCRRGRENYCLQLGGQGAGRAGGHDGGMAEYLLVPAARYLVT
ncbi:alcohol dehydrogenase catalytic domain-containing protein [Streptomyces cinerochromogenes]|uniref:Alcohol dehydrogenase catalytic domain-containing protein n=1 Tax=Streptomyces cinerochromogenes TaxID=66422 RepID=A0ABW7B9V6_9ACTN